MKTLNRPMFRMGGPIKEGIMDGIEEPRQGFNTGSKPPGFFGLSFKEPMNIADLFKSPKTVEKEKQKLASIFAPDYSMSDYGKFPKLVNPTDQLLASAGMPDGTKLPDKKYEMTEPMESIITTEDIDMTSGDQDDAFNITEEKKIGGDASIIIPPKKPDVKKVAEVDTAKDIDEKRLREILGYDRAVKRGNYSLIEAIRKGLTEGGVQGALNAAFAAGDTAYKDAEKLRQVADLKQYERELELKDYDKKRKDAIEDYETKLGIKKRLDPEKQAKGIIEKNYNFLTGILGMDPDKARRIATKETEATIDAQILAVQKGSGLPAITTDILDAAGGVYYGNEYKGRISSATDTGEIADGWYLVDGKTYVEIEAGTIKSKSRTYSPRG